MKDKIIDFILVSVLIVALFGYVAIQAGFGGVFPPTITPVTTQMSTVTNTITFTLTSTMTFTSTPSFVTTPSLTATPTPTELSTATLIAITPTVIAVETP